MDYSITYCTSLHFLPIEVVIQLLSQEDLYAGKTLAPTLISHTVMALLLRTSLSKNFFKNFVFSEMHLSEAAILAYEQKQKIFEMPPRRFLICMVLASFVESIN